MQPCSPKPQKTPQPHPNPPDPIPDPPKCHPPTTNSTRAQPSIRQDLTHMYDACLHENLMTNIDFLTRLHRQGLTYVCSPYIIHYSGVLQRESEPQALNCRLRCACSPGTTELFRQHAWQRPALLYRPRRHFYGCICRGIIIFVGCCTL